MLGGVVVEVQGVLALDQDQAPPDHLGVGEEEEEVQKQTQKRYVRQNNSMSRFIVCVMRELAIETKYLEPNLLESLKSVYLIAT
ncbi:Hypothetical predicted protein [Mytilus galloprovincialis]|uniref:Uncharacterized protein n=1 Tax=Mytilus galloprovincialis TaxID=29158 RepID=A0A8B6G5F6_MYTGA|nr:Hypothetical predicted protein [Mytilus galloprovincialis]